MRWFIINHEQLSLAVRNFMNGEAELEVDKRG